MTTSQSSQSKKQTFRQLLAQQKDEKQSDPEFEALCDEMAERKQQRRSPGRPVIHGQSRNPLYYYFAIIKSRCQNPDNLDYKHYGGLGIRFSFPSTIAAVTWVQENLGPGPEKYQVDRINPLEDFAPGNLRWASRRLMVLNRAHDDHRDLPRGVYRAAGGRFRVSVVNESGKMEFLGTFRTVEEARAQAERTRAFYLAIEEGVCRERVAEYHREIGWSVS